MNCGNDTDGATTPKKWKKLFYPRVATRDRVLVTGHDGLWGKGGAECPGDRSPVTNGRIRDSPPWLWGLEFLYE